jgi:membrane fusion protein, multidrug efflux system
MKTANAIGTIAAVLMAGCYGEPLPPIAAHSPKPVIVRAELAGKRIHVATEEVVGTVRAKLHAAIEAKISARIEEMRVAPGDAVKAGDLLVKLDARETQARFEQALAERDQLQRDAARLRSLLAQNAVSRQEFETVESRYRVAVAAVSETETMLSYAWVLAPFDGIVTRKLADVGDLATPGRSLIEIDNPKALRLEAEVPESLIARVEAGAKLRVRAADRPDFIAPVSEISPAANPISRTFTVKLDLPAPAGMRAGQFARVAVPLGEHEGIWLPKSALVVRGQMELVFVLPKAGDKALLRLVKTGKHMGDSVEVVSGISAGERVVVDGALQLNDGQPVEVKK